MATSDFKEAMDNYESFMNDYVDFMKKYKGKPDRSQPYHRLADIYQQI
ncbi:MAG: DUF6591 domain-containing protein [[Eubacterium] siraeum]